MFLKVISAVASRLLFYVFVRLKGSVLLLSTLISMCLPCDATVLQKLSNSDVLGYTLVPMSLPPVLGIVGIRINFILGAKPDGKSETP